MQTAPTLVDPAVACGCDMEGALVWRLGLLNDAEHLVLPDLSCDAVRSDDPSSAQKTASSS